MAPKTPQPKLITTWDDVNDALSLMNQLINDMRAITAQYEPQIRQLSTEQDEKLKPIQEHLDELEHRVTVFAEEHLDDFTDKKSKLLPAGQVSIRQVTNIEVPNEERTAEALKKHGYANCLKETVKPIKAALKALSDEVMRLVYVKRVISNKVAVEPLSLKNK